jgi:hypothetical protein
VTATSVWLTEMGLDITLVRIQAYQTTNGVVVTVSQHYPPPDVEELTVAPTRASRKPKATETLPEVEWTAEDYARAAEILTNKTALAALDLCSKRPDEWVPFEDVVAASGREYASAKGDTGGFGITVRRRFSRTNWPFETMWAAGGKQQSYYRMTAAQATMWRAVRGGELVNETPELDA